MTDNQDKINKLIEKTDVLLKRQDDFYSEINSLRIEINNLRAADIQNNLPKEEAKVVVQTSLPVENETLANKTTEQKLAREPQPKPVVTPPVQTFPKTQKKPKIKLDLEKFIGENLINKIGIAITIIGVGIGAKYSIENDLISPLTRIILGYLVALGLLGFGVKLKQKYENYSAVLVSGSIAIMYFLTFSAYAFYALIPQFLAFLLMVVFTVFTVVAAINYNKQVIALIGLVGAYAVPFLLSEGKGNVEILFGYMAIINIGILVIAVKRYWKLVYYSSFALTWIIFVTWYINKYEMSEHFGLALMFLTLFFVIFYGTFLAYKLIKKEKFNVGDTFLIIPNSFIFYGLGFAILNDHTIGGQLLGLFTLFNGIIHFVISVIIYKKKLADRNLLYLIAGMVLIFITITIPVQLDGNWVTLLWAGEAALLFWIGRTKKIPIYEKISYPLMLLALFSIVHDWKEVYSFYYLDDVETRFTPVLNIHFLTSLIVIAAFGFINFINQRKEYTSAFVLNVTLQKLSTIFVTALFLIIMYFGFRMEISYYWEVLYMDSEITLTTNGYKDYYNNYDLNKFQSIWIINYSLLFVSIISLINFKKIKNEVFGLVNIGFNILTLVVFLIQGLYLLSSLRDSYLDQTVLEFYKVGVFNIIIRYVSLAFFILTLVLSFKYVRQPFIKKNLTIPFDFVLYISILWILSSELINWMEIASVYQTYKLGLSILWGIYSLFLIVLGIWKTKKHLRIGAIVIFGITLIKLFIYDISHLNTISKTIVFVSLGVLLLIISFLYNKYKHLISDENND